MVPLRLKQGGPQGRICQQNTLQGHCYSCICSRVGIWNSDHQTLVPGTKASYTGYLALLKGRPYSTNTCMKNSHPTLLKGSTICELSCQFYEIYGMNWYLLEFF